MQTSILVVDDDPDILELMSCILQEQNFTVTPANSGESGLSILEDTEFEIVITDCIMPGIQGKEFVHAVKSKNPSQRIIAISASSNALDLLDAIQAGANNVITKPIKEECLLEAVEVNLLAEFS